MKLNIKVPALALPLGDEFTTTWQTTAPDETITLPFIIGYSYNCVVDWGDGNSDTITAWNQAEITHTYATAGDYTVSITGLMEAWSFNNIGDKSKIHTIEQFGTTGLTGNGIYGMFRGCDNLTSNATDAPNLSGVTSLVNSFNRCPVILIDVSEWDLGAVTNIQGMFANSNIVVPDTRNWSIGSITNISWVFTDTDEANPDVSLWDTSKVTRINRVFAYAIKAIPDVSNWDTRNVSIADEAFLNAPLANPDCSQWEIPLVTTMVDFATNAPSFSTANYDAMLANFAGQTVQPNVPLNVDAQYTDQAARDILTNAPNNWIITDGGLAP